MGWPFLMFATVVVHMISGNAADIALQKLDARQRRNPGPPEIEPRNPSPVYRRMGGGLIDPKSGSQVNPKIARMIHRRNPGAKTDVELHRRNDGAGVDPKATIPFYRRSPGGRINPKEASPLHRRNPGADISRKVAFPIDRRASGYAAGRIVSDDDSSIVERPADGKSIPLTNNDPSPTG